MEFKRCLNCGEYDFTEKHTCKPEWEAKFIDDNESDRAFGDNADDVAIRYAELKWCFIDYPEEMEILVRKQGEKWQKFCVSVAMIPDFSAYSLD